MVADSIRRKQDGENTPKASEPEARVAGEGGTIEYNGIAGFSSCRLRCGGEEGEIVRIDGSFLASLR